VDEWLAHIIQGFFYSRPSKTGAMVILWKSVLEQIVPTSLFRARYDFPAFSDSAQFLKSAPVGTRRATLMKPLQKQNQIPDTQLHGR